MKKRKRIFLETLVLGLTLIFIATTIAPCTYAGLFDTSPSEKIRLGQQRESQKLRDWGSQELLCTSFAPGSGSIRNTIRVNTKTSHWPTQMSPSYPRSITGQTLFQSRPRASPV